MSQLEAVLLGHVTRQRLVHSVREEYLRIVEEIDVENASCVKWPRLNTLCLPVFMETALEEGVQEGTVDKDSALKETGDDTGAPLQEGEEGGPSRGLEATELLREEQLDKPLELSDDSFGERTPDLLQVEMEKAAVAGDVEDSSICGHTAPVDVAAATSTELHEDTEVSGKPSVCPYQDINPGSIQGSCRQLLDSLDPVPSELPRDRETLVDLRTQLAMELLWLKQAIASRQDYLKLKKKMDNKTS